MRYHLKSFWGLNKDLQSHCWLYLCTMFAWQWIYPLYKSHFLILHNLPSGEDKNEEHFYFQTHQSLAPSYSFNSSSSRLPLSSHIYHRLWNETKWFQATFLSKNLFTRSEASLRNCFLFCYSRWSSKNFLLVYNKCSVFASF